MRRAVVDETGHIVRTGDVERISTAERGRGWGEVPLDDYTSHPKEKRILVYKDKGRLPAQAMA